MVKWLIVVSGSSYIIYLFHTTFEGLVKSLVHKIGSDGGIWFTAEAVCVIAAGVLLPMLLHRHVLARHGIAQMLFGLR